MAHQQLRREATPSCCLLRALEEERKHRFRRLSPTPSEHATHTSPAMGNKNKLNGDAESNPSKDEDVGAEGDETTDDEGGVDTPPPQKEEEEDAPNEDGTFEVGVSWPREDIVSALPPI